MGGLFPLALILLDAWTGALGANPVQRALHQTGLLALVLLILSLACTPLRLVFRWTWPARIRRALGLLASLYAGLHFLIYLFDQGFMPGTIVTDVLERPFITAGFTALLLLVPLVMTSRADSVRRLGLARWQRLHQLVYVSVSLAALHYWWGVKKDHTAPLLCALMIAALFAVRVVWKRRQPVRRRATSPGD